MVKSFKLISATLISLCIGCSNEVSYGAQDQTYLTPFAKNSLWNSKPLNPVFSDFVIPTSDYFPSIHNGQYSTGCFYATASDQPMKIKGTKGQKGVFDADAETFHEELILPHWPADLIPASGGDGHADIFDVATGIIHSFWQLKKVDGEWRATHYGWMPMKGSGWADAAHYHQGARATGVPACAGIIRKHEISDGEPLYHHALAISLTHNSLSANPPYIFPATISDRFVDKNKGPISEGSLIMLPADFDINVFKTPEIKKIAKTLQVHGAYVVDENYGTPYVIYVERGGSLDIHKGLWNNAAAEELQLLRKQLRKVTSVSGYLDAEGNNFQPNANVNVLSMRGPWYLESGQALGKYDSYNQSIVFSGSGRKTVQSNESGRSMHTVLWAKPKKGERYKLSVTATGGAQLNLKVLDGATRKLVYETGNVPDGQSVTFEWPVDSFVPKLVLTSGVDNQSSISATLLKDQ
ncbi:MULTISPECIES: hypothetical protein [unclassified Methylophilus]|uniref:hypothetical protein n=1 Tax=unclassified Methylophilus TaxID=2630143 RepID=UPI00037F0749|nr:MULTISPECIES: hypothetical protein [unclassified Methylophilus]